MNSFLTNHLFVIFTYETLLLDVHHYNITELNVKDTSMKLFLLEKKKVNSSHPHLNLHFCWQCLPHITRSRQDSLFQLLDIYEVRIKFPYYVGYDICICKNCQNQ